MANFRDRRGLPWNAGMFVGQACFAEGGTAWQKTQNITSPEDNNILSGRKSHLTFAIEVSLAKKAKSQKSSLRAFVYSNRNQLNWLLPTPVSFFPNPAVGCFLPVSGSPGTFMLLFPMTGNPYVLSTRPLPVSRYPNRLWTRTRRQNLLFSWWRWFRHIYSGGATE